MLNLAASLIRLIVFLVTISISTITLTTILVILSIPKIILTNKKSREFMAKVTDFVGNTWGKVNNIIMATVLPKIDWQIQGHESLSLNKSYLLFSNHQTWVDVIVLQKALVGKIPFLRFFIKKDIIWIPFIGIACWAMGLPFLKRYSPEYLKKYPEKKGQDIEITKKFFQDLPSFPITIGSFVEGTRFTKKKHEKQQSPFKNLLKPKAGGVAFAIESLHHRLDTLINLTIVYPDGIPTIVDLFMGKVKTVKVIIEELNLPKNIASGYFDDKGKKEEFYNWLNELWLKNDATIEKHK